MYNFSSRAESSFVQNDSELNNTYDRNPSTGPSSFRFTLEQILAVFHELCDYQQNRGQISSIYDLETFIGNVLEHNLPVTNSLSNFRRFKVGATKVLSSAFQEAILKQATPSNYGNILTIMEQCLHNDEYCMRSLLDLIKYNVDFLYEDMLLDVKYELLQYFDRPTDNSPHASMQDPTRNFDVMQSNYNYSNRDTGSYQHLLDSTYTGGRQQTVTSGFPNHPPQHPLNQYANTQSAYPDKQRQQQLQQQQQYQQYQSSPRDTRGAPSNFYQPPPPPPPQKQYQSPRYHPNAQQVHGQTNPYQNNYLHEGSYSQQNPSHVYDNSNVNINHNNYNCNYRPSNNNYTPSHHHAHHRQQSAPPSYEYNTNMRSSMNQPNAYMNPSFPGTDRNYSSAKTYETFNVPKSFPQQQSLQRKPVGNVSRTSNSHREKLHPILKVFIVHIRKFHMEVIFPQRVHDKVLVCLYVALKSFTKPVVHRELIHLAMVLKESGYVAGVEHVSKTKVRGVLAILKQGELVVKSGALGEAVQLCLSEDILSFEMLRDRHDHFLVSYMIENMMNIPEELQGEVVWKIDGDMRANRLRTIQEMIWSLEQIAVEAKEAMKGMIFTEDEDDAESFRVVDDLLN